MINGILWFLAYTALLLFALGALRCPRAHWEPYKNGWSICSWCGYFSKENESRCPACNAKMKKRR